MPLSLNAPSDIRILRTPTANSSPIRLSPEPNAICASASDFTLAIRLSAFFRRRRAIDISMVLETAMVQVVSDAKASAIITAFTRMSAERNIDHGESS